MARNPAAIAELSKPNPERKPAHRGFATGTRSSVRFAVATRADDADLRRLLRETPMPGQITLTMEREPDYFADAHGPGEHRQTIVAREHDRVVCMGSCAVRPRFVNGKPRRVGYLGGLRLRADQAGRFDILRRGYDYFRELQEVQPADFYFTSIAADNVRARQFLERGLPGLPRYEFLGEYLTLVLPTKRSWAFRAPRNPSISPPSTDELAAFLQSTHRHDQFSPCWTAEELEALGPLGLSRDHWCFVRDQGRLTAAAAIWDQRAFKQTVIRGYAPTLRRARAFLNIVSRLAGGPRLPAVGETLAQAFVSHLAVPPDSPRLFNELLDLLRASAAERGLEYLTLGFAVDDRGQAAVAGGPFGRTYRSRLYLVRWPDQGGARVELDGRPLAPEVALL